MEDQAAAEQARNNAKYNNKNFKLKQANYDSYYQSSGKAGPAQHTKGGEY